MSAARAIGRFLLILAAPLGVAVSSEARVADDRSATSDASRATAAMLDSARSAWSLGRFEQAERLAQAGIATHVGPYPDTLLIDRAHALLIGARAARIAATRPGRRGAPGSLRTDTLQAIAAADTFAISRMEGAQQRVAQRMLERGLALREKLGAPENLVTARALHVLGNAVSMLGDYLRGIEYYQRAIIIYRRLDGLHGRVHNAEANVGLMMMFLGDLGEARRIYENLIEDMEQNHPDKRLNLSNYYMQLSDVYAPLEEDPRLIQRVLERCIELRRANGMANEWLTDPSIRLAATYTRLGDAARATALLDSLRTDLVLRPDRTNVGDLELHRADALLALGRYGEAEEDARSAFVQCVATWGSDHPKIMEASETIAWARVGTRDWLGAVAAAESAGALGRRWLPDLHPGQGRALLVLAQATAGAGERTRAFGHAIEAERRLRDALFYVSPGLGDDAAFRMDRDRGRALGLAATLISSESPGAHRRLLLDAVVRSRAIVLDLQVSRIQTIAGDSAGRRLQDEYQAACTRLANLVMRQIRSETAERSRREVEEARIVRNRAGAALAARSSAFSLRRDRGAAGLAEVLAALPADAALVSYVRYPSFDTTARPPRAAEAWHYSALVARPDGGDPAWIPLGDAETLDRLIERWRSEVGRGSAGRGPDRLQAGNALRRVLWDPVATAAGRVADVVMVADGAIQLVNFAALPTEGNRFLIESGPRIVTLTTERDAVPAKQRMPGTGLLALGGVDYERATPLRSGELSLEGSHLSIGDTYRSARASCTGFATLRLKPLPASFLEARDVASLWSVGGPDTAALLLSGEEATEDRFKRLAPGFRSLHVATHGFFLAPACDSVSSSVGTLFRDAPLLRSGLALSGFNNRDQTPEDQEDGVLTAEEVAALDLTGVDCVVLSACESGLGLATAGEGVIGLRRAFQAAGAGSLVTSLWPVRDQPARGWMREFYASLTRGLAPAEAAYDASRTMLSRLSAGERAAHVADWGAFMVVGGWR